MPHTAEFSTPTPLQPLADYPRHIQARFGTKPPRNALA
jgi:hypothetical protein